MKKVYLTGALLIGALSTFAQQKTEVYNFNQSKKAENALIDRVPSQNQVKPVNVTEKAITSIWSENFTTTGTLTTSNGVWVTGGTNSAYWATASTHPMSAYGFTDNLTGSFLAWSSFIPNANETNFASTAVSGEITSPTIDMSTIANGAVITFKTEAMYCCNSSLIPFAIAVSEDDGSTWSAPITVNLGVDRNVATEDISNPKSIIVDLSTLTTAHSATTKIKFLWDGVTADNNGQFNTHYYWLIDDIAIYDKLNYDLSVENLWLNDITTGYEHTDIPQNLAGNLTVQAKIRNTGKLIPTNTQLLVNVYNAAGTSVATQTGGTLKNNFALEYDTITFPTTIDLSALTINSTYTVKAELVYTQTDQNNVNDTMRRTMKITDFYLGQRVYELPTSPESVGNSQVSGTASGEMTVGNVMSIPSSITTIPLHGLEVTLQKSTSFPITIGTEVEIKLYEMDYTAAAFDDMPLDLGESRYFTITSANIPGTGATKNVLFNFHQSTSAAGPMTLEGGKDYIIAIHHIGDATHHFAYATNPTDDDNSSRIYGPFSSSNTNNHWFTNGTQILTRMCFDQSLGLESIANNSVSVSNIFPNPTTGSTAVNYSLENASEVSISVVDVTGKVVYSSTEGTQVAGKHTSTIDASSFNTGVYYVTITTNDSQVTKKLIKK